MSKNYPKIIRKLSETYPKIIQNEWSLESSFWQQHIRQNRIWYAYESSFLIENCKNFKYLNCTFTDLEGKNYSFMCFHGSVLSTFTSLKNTKCSEIQNANNFCSDDIKVKTLIREHSYMMSDVFRAFLTYLPTLIRYFTT